MFDKKEIADMEKLTKNNAFNNLPHEIEIRDAAALLSISPQTIERLKDDGELCIEGGFIKQEELLRYIQRHFIVNIPAFTIEENIESYIQQHGDIPLVIDLETIIYILNELPETLKNWPGFTGQKIEKKAFIDYLQTHQNIDFIELKNTVKQHKTR